MDQSVQRCMRMLDRSSVPQDAVMESEHSKTKRTTKDAYIRPPAHMHIDVIRFILSVHISSASIERDQRHARSTSFSPPEMYLRIYDVRIASHLSLT